MLFAQSSTHRRCYVRVMVCNRKNKIISTPPRASGMKSINSGVLLEWVLVTTKIVHGNRCEILSVCCKDQEHKILLHARLSMLVWRISSFSFVQKKGESDSPVSVSNLNINAGWVQRIGNDSKSITWAIMLTHSSKCKHCITLWCFSSVMRWCYGLLSPARGLCNGKRKDISLLTQSCPRCSRHSCHHYGKRYECGDPAQTSDQNICRFCNN